MMVRHAASSTAVNNATQQQQRRVTTTHLHRGAPPSDLRLPVENRARGDDDEVRAPDGAGGSKVGQQRDRLDRLACSRGAASQRATQWSGKHSDGNGGVKTSAGKMQNELSAS